MVKQALTTGAAEHYERTDAKIHQQPGRERNRKVFLTAIEHAQHLFFV
jgi:hypothetical protein